MSQRGDGRKTPMTRVTGRSARPTCPTGKCRESRGVAGPVQYDGFANRSGLSMMGGCKGHGNSAALPVCGGAYSHFLSAQLAS